MARPNQSTYGLTISANLLVALLLGNSAAMSQEAADVARLAKELESDDRQTATAAFAELTAIGKKRLPNESAEARRLVNDYRERAEAFHRRIGRRDVIRKMTWLTIDSKEPVLLTEMRYVYAEPNLEWLTVVSPHCDDKHLEYFASVPTLFSLTIDGTQATGSCLRRLPTEQLKILRFCASPLNEKYLLEAKFPKLELLDLRESPVTNAIIEKLDAPELTHLYFGGTKIELTGLASLTRFPKLRGIRLDSRLLTKELQAQLMRDNPALQISISDSYNLKARLE
jgi:hypothetical protein